MSYFLQKSHPEANEHFDFCAFTTLRQWGFWDIFGQEGKTMGACIWSRRRALSLAWVVLASIRPCLTPELPAPHLTHFFLPHNGREGKKQENLKTHEFPIASLWKEGGGTSTRRAGCQAMHQTSSSKYYSRVRDTISVFDWYETNLCPEVSAITKVRVKFIRVACSTEGDILVLVCHRIILDVLRKNPTALKKNP